MPTQTAAQKRAQARADYDAFLARCPSRQLLNRISDKWVALVLAALGDADPHSANDSVSEARSMRYSELSRQLAGVSQKMLTQTLRSLERDGLLTRTVAPTVPTTVTYTLTDLGLSLQHLMRAIKAWAEAHMDEVLVNRDNYDTRSEAHPRCSAGSEHQARPSSTITTVQSHEDGDNAHSRVPG